MTSTHLAGVELGVLACWMVCPFLTLGMGSEVDFHPDSSTTAGLVVSRPPGPVAGPVVAAAALRGRCPTVSALGSTAAPLKAL